MKRTLLTVSGLSAWVLCGLFSSAFYPKEEGMFFKWQIPFDAINQKFHSQFTAEKAERLFRGSVRISVGGSGSFISPTGLVYTNHHIVESCIESLRGHAQISPKGFFDAKDYSQELRCPGYVVHTTLDIRDATDFINSALNYKAAVQTLLDECKDNQPSIECRLSRVGSNQRESTPSVTGGTSDHFILERLRAYNDVRLVYAPSQERAFVGMEFNFQYPRYDLDFGFLRVYDESTGGPLNTSDVFLKPDLGDKPLAEGDLTMIVGHPGATQRYLSSWALTFHRDVYVAQRKALYESKVKDLDKEISDLDSKTDDASRLKRSELVSDRFSYSNAYQKYQGTLEGLKNNSWIDGRIQEDKKLAEAIVASSTGTSGADVSTLVQLEATYRELAGIYPEYLRSGGKTSKKRVEQLLVVARELHTKYLEIRNTYQGFKMGYYDANFSQRFSYGSIRGINQPGVSPVSWATYFSDLNKYVGEQPTLGGKAMSDVLNENSVEFLRREGEKADTKDMVVDFITDNDTTGGNSGSGVFNKNLEVVGALFDGNWSSLANDYSFQADPTARSVVVALKACVHYMKNGNDNHRIYKELEAAYRQ